LASIPKRQMFGYNDGMENLTENTLDKEVRKRIQKRIAINRICISWIVIFNVFGAILLYITFWIGLGLESAIQNLFTTIATILALDILGYIGFLGFLMFHEIPEEIYQEQRKIINEHLPKQLALTIERTPSVLTKGGKNFRAAALYITSTENKKLIELQALVNFEHFYYIKDREYVGQASYRLNTPLYWIGEDPPKTEIELLPNIGKIVLICELIEGQYNDNDEKVWLARMGSKTVPTGRIDEESIYKINILFQGKLEGEYEIRSYLYNEVFYAKPANQRILFLDDAEKAYSDIPQKLSERSKSAIEYLERKNEQKRTKAKEQKV